jgi:hypothetical protein
VLQASQLEIAWAAGIIDGEGCIFISRVMPTATNACLQTHYRLGIKVTMGCKATVEKVSEIFGSGSKYTVAQVRWNYAYTWMVWTNGAKDCLLAIQPYCITKSKEIEVALEFLDMPKWYGGQHRGPKSPEHQQAEYDIWDRMRRLKPRTALKLSKERSDQSVKDSVPSQHDSEQVTSNR